MRHILYTGSYSDPVGEPSIRFYMFDDTTLSFTPLLDSSQTINASFLHMENAQLLAVSEQKTQGHLDLYTVRKDALVLADRLCIDGADLCHIHHWKNTPFYSAANYSSGDFIIVSVADNHLRFIQQVKHHGIGFDCKGRQEGPHVHSTLLSPDGRILYAADLGLDKIAAYEVNADGTVAAMPQEFHLSFPGGQGPRHMSFSPDGTYFFAVTEMGARLYMFRNVPGQPMQLIADVSILPETFRGKNLSADVHISSDGRFVYASNRGADTIAVFRISGTDSKLSLVGHYPAHGQGPRNFCLSRDGKYLFAANQYTGNLTVFRRDTQSGALKFIQNSLQIPNCVFVNESDCY